MALDHLDNSGLLKHYVGCMQLADTSDSTEEYLKWIGSADDARDEILARNLEIPQVPPANYEGQ